MQVVCVNHNKAESDKAAEADQEDPGYSLPLPSSQQTQHSREETNEAGEEYPVMDINDTLNLHYICCFDHF